MFEKKLKQEDFVDVMTRLNLDVRFYSGPGVGVYTLDYSKPTLSGLGSDVEILEQQIRHLNDRLVEQVEDFRRLLDYLNLELEEGKRIIKRKKKKNA